MHHLSKELAEQGHEIDVVTMGFDQLKEYEHVDGINVFRVPGIRATQDRCNMHEMIPYVLFAVPAVLKLIRQKDYSLNHTHFVFPTGLLSFIIKRMTGLPYILTAHGSDVPGYNPERFVWGHKLLGPPWRMIVGGASKITSPTASLKSLIVKNARDANVVEIPNGLRLGRFLPREKTKRILLVSRIFKRKGFQYFLEALKGMDLDYELNIVGDGPYLGTLQQKAEDLGVTVNFWGWLGNESVELKELYETSPIFVLPSEAENFPIVLLEAMSAGMAIISTSNTGCHEVVGDAALLVEPRNPRALRDAVIRLVNDGDLRNKLGKAARRRIEDNFTWTAVTKRFLDVYAECAWNSERPGQVTDSKGAFMP